MQNNHTALRRHVYCCKCSAYFIHQCFCIACDPTVRLYPMNCALSVCGCMTLLQNVRLTLIVRNTARGCQPPVCGLVTLVTRDRWPGERGGAVSQPPFAGSDHSLPAPAATTARTSTHNGRICTAVITVFPIAQRSLKTVCCL